MIFQNSMGPRKSNCDVPSGTTQGWVCPSTIPTKGLRNITFKNKYSMIFYTYIKKTIKNKISHQILQFVLRLWNSNKMILKCSLIHYAMKSLMLMIFFKLKLFLPLNFPLKI